MYSADSSSFLLSSSLHFLLRPSSSSSSPIFPIKLLHLLFFSFVLPPPSSPISTNGPSSSSLSPLSSSPFPQVGCVRSGQPICCSGRNISCKSAEERRRPIFSFALRDDQVREVRFGKNCIGRMVLPDLISLNEHGQQIVRQLGQRTHFRVQRSAATNNEQEETVFQFGWWEQREEEDRAEHWRMDVDNSPIVRYSLLSRQLPLRIIKRRLRASQLPRGRQMGANFGEWSTGEPWRTHFLVESQADCFCDEFCTDYGDCCTNYVQMCPPFDCAVNEWSVWSDCTPDDGICGVGIKERRRSVVRERRNSGVKCPELVERVGCFKECSSAAIQADDAHRIRPDITTVALLLDYKFNASRQTLPSLFRKSTSRRRIGTDEEEYAKYCVHYRVEWLNRECTEREWSSKLGTGQVICAECQPEAQFHRPSPRCASDLEDGQSGFWKLIGPKYCYGIWRRLSSTGGSRRPPSPPDCECAKQFPQLQPFLMV